MVNMSYRITLKEVARAAGVSIGTVDRALNNRKGINSEVKIHVLKKMKELGYRKNIRASSLSLKTKKNVGIIYPGVPAFFWGKLDKGIKDAEKEFEGYGINYINYILEEEMLSNDKEILKYIDDLIKEKVDIIALAPFITTPLLKSKLKEINDYGIPLISLNEEFDNEIKGVFHIGIDNELSGKIAAELIGKFLRGKGNVLIILNTQTQEFAFHSKRLAGFKTVLAERYPNINIAGCYIYNYLMGEEYNYEMLRSIVGNSASLDGIYDFDGASLCKVGSIIKGAAMGSEIILVGHEISDEVRKLLKEDLIHAVVNQDPYLQGYTLIKTIHSYLFFGEVPHNNVIYTDIEIILRENS
jgi:LacI family transcriptional regulator